MLNPFFQQGTTQEQGLIQDLINEQLRMYGVEVYYLPRRFLSENKVIKEVIESSFEDAFPIEAYLNSYEGYSDNPTILSKFGIQALNELVITISRERFELYISPLLKNKPNIKLSSRPKEGDLIYFPYGDRLFEIKYVEHEKPFYQLQGNYTYELRCELFRYEEEVIDTGVEEIDDVLATINNGEGESISIGPTQTLIMVGSASTASAVASIFDGAIRTITVTNRGGGYTTIPKVGISSSPSGGTTGIATATLIGGIVVCNTNINPSSKSVQSVEIINSGSGYSSAPGVRFVGGGGSNARAISSIGDGVVGIITVINSGMGYTVSPTVTFSGISSSPAIAKAILDNNGKVVAINIIDGGLGYVDPPTITISSPDISGVGTYFFNEEIIGSESGTTARVRSWNSITNKLEVSSITGQFIVGESIVGTASSSSHKIRLINLDTENDGYSSNNEIEIEADKILDFSETNPFGSP